MKIASCDVNTTVFKEVTPCNMADGTNISNKHTTIQQFHSSTLKMEAADSATTLVPTYHAEDCSNETNSGILVGETDKGTKNNAHTPSQAQFTKQRVKGMPSSMPIGTVSNCF
jgi:hypothetical protein